MGHTVHDLAPGREKEPAEQVYLPLYCTGSLLQQVGRGGRGSGEQVA